MRVKALPAPGFALLLVLWGVMLIALLVTALARSSSLEAHRFANTMNAAAARAALDSGFAAGVVGMLSDDPTRQWHADGSPYAVVLDGATFRIDIRSENGRIDLNSTRPDLLGRFLQDRLGAELTAAIVAEGRTVLAVSQANFRPLLSIVELSAAPAMDAKTYAAFAADATVQNRSGLLDWRTADGATLSLVPGMTPDGLAQLMAHRRESHYTLDPALARILAGAVRESLSNENQAYTMRLSVHMPNQAESTAEVLFRLTRQGSKPYRILEWRSPAPEAAS